jgi:hypothetical protein
VKVEDKGQAFLFGEFPLLFNVRLKNSLQDFNENVFCRKGTV